MQTDALRKDTWSEMEEEQLTPRIGRRMLHTQNVTVAKIRLDRGALVPLHHHVSEQVTMVEKGRLLVRFEGQEIELSVGQLVRIPAHLPHSVEALEDSLATDVFSPAREDWIRGDDAYLRGAAR